MTLNPRPQHGERGGGTSRSATASARQTTGCSTAAPARPASPSSKAPLCSTPSSRTTRSSRSWSTLAEGCGVRQTARLVGVNKTRHAVGPAGRPARQSHPRRVGGFFPPRPARSSSMRSGRSWARSRRTATPRTPTTTTAATTGTTSPSTPSTSLFWRWSPARGHKENARAIVAEVKQRVGSDPPPLMTSDEYPAYATAIEEVFSEPVPAPSRSQAGTASHGARASAAGRRDLRDGAQASGERPRHRRGADGRSSARRKGWRTCSANPPASCRVNTSFVERQNGTDRGRNARKTRKTYRFSKDWQVHEAMTYLTLHSNSC